MILYLIIALILVLIICTLHSRSKEHFIANLCSQNKIDSILVNVRSKSQNNFVYEMDDATLQKIFNEYSRSKTLIHKKTHDISIEKSDELMLKYKFTEWLSMQQKLSNFVCIKLVLLTHRKINNDLYIKAEAIIHRQSKNQGKHLIIEAEIVDNKFHLINTVVKGSVFQDKLNMSYSFSSSFSPRYAVYSVEDNVSF